MKRAFEIISAVNHASCFVPFGATVYVGEVVKSTELPENCEGARSYIAMGNGQVLYCTNPFRQLKAQYEGQWFPDVSLTDEAGIIEPTNLLPA